MDTMILANINPGKGTITLVSIPRDLYYNGRKINSIYALYGMEELKRSLSFITGYKIDKFIMIDMYAFIEVIDIIGGVDVHLNSPVIDPTYKTCDAGKCSTLYYRVGDHHLSGKQALRLARTRHTSSDFARAERQHIILSAIKKKAQESGFGNANHLRQIAQTILSKVNTDISLADGLSYYFRYQKLTIKGGNVLSTGNVLTSKYTGELKPRAPECNKPVATDAANTTNPTTKSPASCKQEKGEYILLPSGGNWNTIRWYFREIIGS